MQIEDKQMEECTFTPQITGIPKPQKKPVFVRGIREFMERKKYAEKLEEEERERVRRAFEVDRNILKMRKGGRYTETHPFTFQTEIDSRGDNRRTTKYLKVKEVQSRKKNQCTFWPRTLYRSNKELVRKILDSSETIAE